MSRWLGSVLVVLCACSAGVDEPPLVTGLPASASAADETGGSTGDVFTSGMATSSGSDASASMSTTGSSPTTTSGPGTSGVDSTASQTTEEDGGSSSSGVEPVSWRRYSLDVDAGVWSSVPLDEIWVGPNAPPTTGIVATTALTLFDRIYVVSDAGMVYEQADGVWQTPEPIAERFPAAADLDVSSMQHTPSQGKTSSEDVFLIGPQTAVIYTQFENGGLELANVVDLMDTKGGAPQASVVNDWTVTVIQIEGIGVDVDWLRWYGAYANELWLFNAAFEWTLYPLDDSPFFSGAPGAPDPFDVRAAYHDDAFGRAHFIAP
ncbi:MAG: hypothetical protein AAGA54_27715 [Myxococcota bacterium]